MKLSSRLLAVAFCVCSAHASLGTPVISEIYFHPPHPAGVEDVTKEWIEIHNPDAAAADVSGWKLTKGVSFTIPAGTTIPAGETMVIAAHVATFTAEHPGYTGLLRGGWTGQLSNSGEAIRLATQLNVQMEEVDYSDEGEWAKRVRGPADLGHNGWTWECLADGGGASLQRLSAVVSGDTGGNWDSASPPTPGVVVTNTEFAFPVVKNVKHQPEIPRSTDAVTVSAEIRDFDNARIASALLRWQTATSSGNVALLDPDGDGVVEGILPIQSNNTVVEYWIESISAFHGAISYWPKPTRLTQPGVLPEVFDQVCNPMYQVDDTFNPATAWTPGAPPQFRVILTAAERNEFVNQIWADVGGAALSDAQMNATIISHDGTGISVKHRAGLRNRGDSSRTGTPHNMRFSFPSDEKWNGRSALQVNGRYPHSQMLGGLIFAQAGLASRDGAIVKVKINNTDHASAGSAQYGVYFAGEGLGSEWAERHVPLDAEGNLYQIKQGGIGGAGPEGDLTAASLAIAAVDNPYLKQTNRDVTGFADLENLAAKLADSANPNFITNLQSALQLDQALTFLALNAQMENREGGLYTGRGDDFALYRGITDPRFIFVPHDLDTVFNMGLASNPYDPNLSIFDPYTVGAGTPGNNGVDGLKPLLAHPDIIPLYYCKHIELLDKLFNSQELDPVIELAMRHLGSGHAEVTGAKSWLLLRRAGILAQINRVFSFNTTLPAALNEPVVSRAFDSADGTGTFNGKFDVCHTRSVMVNGVPATLNARTGDWTLTSGSGLIQPGVTYLTAKFFDGKNGTGNLLQSLHMTIYWNKPPAIPVGGTLVARRGSLVLTAPDSYVPGSPLLVRVDVRDDAANIDKTLWDATVNLVAGSGVTVSPNTVSLYNGTGSALLTISGGSGGGGPTVTNQELFKFGVYNATPALNVNGSTWKYLTDGTNPGATWKEESFVDSAWNSGPSQIGYGEAPTGSRDENTLVPHVDFIPGGAQDNVPTYYFRSTFNIVDKTLVTAITGTVKYDDGAVVYINGLEVTGSRINVGAGSTHTTYGTGTGENSTQPFTVPNSMIHNGTNTIAVEIKQRDATSSDMTFDLAMNATITIPGGGSGDSGNFVLAAYLDHLCDRISLTSRGTAAFPSASGNITTDTNWSGVMHVTGDVTVNNGVTLTVAPGTHILLDGDAVAGGSAGKKITINGRLLANGTAAQPIHVTAKNSADRFAGFVFGGGQPSVLSHVFMSHGGRGVAGTGHTGRPILLQLNSANVTLDDCVLTDGACKAIYTSGPSALTVRRCLMQRMVTGPELDNNCSLLMEDTQISDILPHFREGVGSVLDPDDEDCLYVSNAGTAQSILVRRCVFAKCGDDAFDAKDGLLTCEDTIIRDAWDKGISLLRNDLTVARALIVNCDKGITHKGTETGVTRTVNADHVTIVSSNHDLTLPPFGYSRPPVVLDPDTPAAGFYIQFKVGQSVVASPLVMNITNSIASAQEPLRVDDLAGEYTAASLTANYTCFQDTDTTGVPAPSGTGNLSTNPLFVSAGSNFRLQSGSPCRDSGDPAVLDPDASRTDMGAIIYQPALAPPTEVHWTADCSPYRAATNVTVPAGMTLIIDAGASVWFDAGVRLLSQGAVQILGTAEQKVVLSHVPNAPLVTDTVLDTAPLAPPHWAGLRIEGPGPNLVRHVRFINAQGSRAANHGSVGVFGTSATIEYCSFVGTHLRMIYTSNASMIIRYNEFPDMFSPTEGAAALGLDNIAEHVKGDARFPTNGYYVVQGNKFGTNKGHNDVIDIGSNRKPSAVAQILDNEFNGVGDEMMDLDGDFYIAGNFFRKIAKDDETSDRGYASGISTSDFKPATLCVVARNRYSEVDHCLNLKQDATAIFEHNTVYKVRGNFVDRFGNEVIGSAINLFIDENGPAAGTGGAFPGVGAYAGNNIFFEISRVFGNVDPNTNLPEITSDWTHQIEFDHNLVDPAMPDFSVGVRHPGSVMTYGPGNVLGAAQFKNAAGGDFSLKAGSPALAASHLGQDLGALVPNAVWLRSDLPSVAAAASASFVVGGPGMFAYKWRLNGGPWSAVLPIGNVTSSLPADTVRTATLELAGLSNGVQVLELIGRDFAEVWQSEAAPTAFTWTVDTSLMKLVINEVMADNVTAHNVSGTFPDYIELHNAGAAPLNVGGYRLTDNVTKPSKYILPSVSIPAGGYLVVYLDGPSALPGLHAGFSLKSEEGDDVSLFAPVAAGGALLDSVEYGIQVPDYSLGRLGQDGGWNLNIPTPNAANIAARLGDPAQLRINEWLAAGGVRFKDDWVELANTSPLPVALHGLSLTDAPYGAPHKHDFAPLSFIGPSAFLKLIADGKTGSADHVSFGIDDFTQELALFQGVALVDRVAVQPQTDDISQGVTVAGGLAGLEFFALPTTGLANGTSDPAYANALNVLNGLRITEIMYDHPVGPALQYVELTNTGAVALDLGGVRFVEGIDFTFPGGFMLAPGAQCLVVADLAVFRARYGNGPTVAGTFLGNLDNSGETLALRLAQPFDANVLCFHYAGNWHPAAQGGGSALLLVSNATAVQLFAERESWTAGISSPGGALQLLPPHTSVDDWLTYFGGMTFEVDVDADGLQSLVEYGLGSDPFSAAGQQGAARLPAAGMSGDGHLEIVFRLPESALAGSHGCPGVRYEVQGSDDLDGWAMLAEKLPAQASWTGPAVVTVGAPAGGFVTIRVKDLAPVMDNPRRALRLAVIVAP